MGKKLSTPNMPRLETTNRAPSVSSFASLPSRAFDTRNETVPGCEIVRCSRSIYRKLQGWNQDQVRVLLHPYLNEDEIRALQARVSSILWMIRKQIEMKGESAVLF